MLDRPDEPQVSGIAAPGKATRLALVGSGILVSTAYSALTPILPTIEEHFRAAPHAAMLTKFLVMAIGLAMVLVSPWVGLLARLLGHRQLFVTALFLYGTAGASAALLDSIWLVVASRAVVGICTAVISVLVVSTMLRMEDVKLRASLLGKWVACSSFGLVVLLPIVGYLGDISWRFPFLLHLIAWLFLAGFSRLEVAGQVKKQPGGKLAGGLWRNRAVVSYIGFSFVIGCIALGTPLFFPYFLKDMGLYSASSAANFFMISVLTAALSALGFGKLLASVSLRPIFGIGFGLMGLGTLLLVLSQGPILLAIAQALSGFGGGIVSPALSLGAGVVALRGQETDTIGLAKGAYSLGLFAGPVLLQPIATVQGVIAVFVIAASAAGLISLGAFLLSGLQRGSATVS